MATDIYAHLLLRLSHPKLDPGPDLHTYVSFLLLSPCLSVFVSVGFTPGKQADRQREREGGSSSWRALFNDNNKNREFGMELGVFHY